MRGKCGGGANLPSRAVIDLRVIEQGNDSIAGEDGFAVDLHDALWGVSAPGGYVCLRDQLAVPDKTVCPEDSNILLSRTYSYQNFFHRNKRRGADF